jgi:hypothetical protein
MTKRRSAQLDARRAAKQVVTTHSRNHITKPTAYRACILVPKGGGFDVIDTRTGHWIHVPSQRLAKWNATVYTRLSDEFNASEVRGIPQLPGEEA